MSVADELETRSLFRLLPSMTRLLELPAIQDLSRRYSRESVIRTASAILDESRNEIAGGIQEEELSRRVEAIPREVARRLEASLRPSLRPVVNATGVVVFTNAGRSPLARQVMVEVEDAGSSYSNLEYDLERGQRGHRDAHFEHRITQLLQCEAATVCNNAAAALMLILNTLAEGREVLVSRGELIEIGGSFRLPAIMEKSGARLKEVGTTNKTRLSDYREALGPETAMILKVHPSNYRVVGFTTEAGIEELAGLSRESGVPLVHDVGSGLLFPAPFPALHDEPTVAGSLAAGADLVSFSGDKLLGGPQAGLILGRRELIRRIRRNPLMRVLRLDKIIYSALDRTLVRYQFAPQPMELPLWRMIGLTAEEIGERARAVAEAAVQESLEIKVIDGISVVGGGSAPEEGIPTRLLAVRSPVSSAVEIEQKLRASDPPILSRIENDWVLLDLRTVFPEQDQAVIRALRTLTS